ncbi:geranylgeranyl reductase family protein [Gordonia sp. X0973]|uniref:geranylgeranyl reductase family protein n=1 Tax=Gordonia sp. X0973 TaxID=2742602 RepID=UPI001581F34E|nr:geranylgeranyl reductase family protein [Gordonia sp. X0973]QKT08371.1 geranylgeranyl reductase family protein [Gordonia sp. X0973]
MSNASPARHESPTTIARTDVLVVGAGPAGSAAAAYAARAGRDVVLIDMAVFPRDKTCGDGLTPRAITELVSLGYGPRLAQLPRIVGLHLHGWGADQRVPWPGKRFADHGSAVPRIEFDDELRALAGEAGATLSSGAKAVDVEWDGDRIGAVVVEDPHGRRSIRASTVIVADGVRSGLGKVLGRQWHRDTAYGVAGRAYVSSGRADDEWMGSHLELRGSDGSLLPGYGWVFPLGGGRLNVGVGALATAKRPAHVELRPTLKHYADMVRDEWQITGEPQRLTSALLPMGGAVSGVAGRNWMLIGDAAACVNPLNGEGIDYGLETARLAVDLLESGADDFTSRWPDILTAHYGLAFSAARRLAAVLTVPQAVPLLGRPGIRSRALMSMVVRVMGNLISDEDADLIARAWRTVGRVSVRVDDRPPFR